MENKQCYMCDADATSVEHVPPKCLFPTIKDSEKNHRVDLITVPSCDKHNGEKSSDDEFLMVSIAGIIGNNSIGYQHYHGKIKRALIRTSYKLLDKVFLKKQFYQFHDDNEFLELLWGTPDYQRLIKCFEHIAMGVYRHHHGANFEGEVKPYLGFLYTNEQNPKAFKELIQHKTAKELESQPKFGSNQEVFYYQYTAPDQFGIFLIKLSFYENVDVYVSHIPRGVEKPNYLVWELVSKGIKTIIDEDGKSFEFN